MADDIGCVRLAGVTDVPPVEAVGALQQGSFPPLKRPADPADRYGDVFVDTARSHEVYKRWLAKCRPAPGPDGLRRPLWLNRPLRPTLEAFYLHPPGAADRSQLPSEETWYYTI